MYTENLEELILLEFFNKSSDTVNGTKYLQKIIKEQNKWMKKFNSILGDNAKNLIPPFRRNTVEEDGLYRTTGQILVMDLPSSKTDLFNQVVKDKKIDEFMELKLTGNQVVITFDFKSKDKPKLK